MWYLCGSGQVLGLYRKIILVSKNSATTASSNDLVPVETEGRYPAAVTGVRAFIVGAEGLGCIFHQLNPEAFANVGEGIKIHRVAEGVHRHNSFYSPTRQHVVAMVIPDFRDFFQVSLKLQRIYA
jgi:hypothetical protein